MIPHKGFSILIILILVLIFVADSQSAEPRIVVGNVINITVLGYPELSTSVKVRRDGTTDYPLLAHVPIDGMTVTELSELLQPLLMKYVERPRLFINISEYLIMRVRIHGQVRNPGPYIVEGPINLQSVISVAGGSIEEADLQHVKIIRREMNKSVTLTYDFYDFLTQELEEATLPEIRDGDIVFVPMLTPDAYVRVMGAVRTPGTYLPRKGETIADMIYRAGGTNQEGNLNNVIFIHLEDDGYSRYKIRLEKILKSGQTDKLPQVNAGDIIIVLEYNSWEKITWWVSIFRDAVYLVSAFIFLSRN